MAQYRVKVFRDDDGLWAFVIETDGKIKEVGGGGGYDSAEDAYRVADAMIADLKDGQDSPS